MTSTGVVAPSGASSGPAGAGGDESDARAPNSGAVFLRVQLFPRVVRAVIVSFWVMVVAFLLIRIAPGDPAMIALGDSATPEALELAREQMGLNDNIAVQFGNYVTNLAQGDLGQSLFGPVTVLTMVKTNLPTTLWLVAVTVLFTLLIAIPLATVIALSRSTWLPYAFRALTAVGLALPTFLVGLVGLLIFGLNLGIAPISGYDPTFPQNLAYLWLPALVNCVVLVPVLSRVLYSSIVDTLDEEFVETGVIRGVGPVRFLWFYILRPSLAPTIVLLSYIMGVMLGATVILEVVFSLPGIGRELVDAVNGRDYPVVQGIILIFGILVVVLSLIGDILASVLDPRVKLT